MTPGLRQRLVAGVARAEHLAQRLEAHDATLRSRAHAMADTATKTLAELPDPLLATDEQLRARHRALVGRDLARKIGGAR